MTWIAKTTFIAASALAFSAPALAHVRVTEGLTVAGTPLLVTSQGEVYSITGASAPARLLGRLPGRASAPVPSGEEAWAVDTGRRHASNVHLYRIDLASEGLETIVPAHTSIDARIQVDGIAGADKRFVYLLPDGRFDRESRELQPGHFDQAPDLRVLRVLVRGERTWYLARDREPDSSGQVRLCLLHESIGNPQGLRVMAGIEEGPVDLYSDDRNLFLVFEAGRVLRFDSSSLRLLEDLSPMLGAKRIRFFAADSRNYWVGTIPADANGDAPLALWRIERSNLDGAPLHAESLRPGYVPLGATDDALWFGAADKPEASPVMAIQKGDLTARAYAVRGLHERHWRAFGRGAADVGETTLIAVAAVPVVALAIVTSPIWIWFVLAEGFC